MKCTCGSEAITSGPNGTVCTMCGGDVSPPMNMGAFQNSRMTQEAATFNLRWNDGILEQMWHITTIDRGRVRGVQNVWRPLPKGVFDDADV